MAQVGLKFGMEGGGRHPIGEFAFQFMGLHPHDVTFVSFQEGSSMMLIGGKPKGRRVRHRFLDVPGTEGYLVLPDFD